MNEQILKIFSESKKEIFVPRITNEVLYLNENKTFIYDKEPMNAQINAEEIFQTISEKADSVIAEKYIKKFLNTRKYLQRPLASIIKKGDLFRYTDIKRMEESLFFVGNAFNINGDISKKIELNIDSIEMKGKKTLVCPIIEEGKVKTTFKDNNFKLTFKLVSPQTFNEIFANLIKEATKSKNYNSFEMLASISDLCKCLSTCSKCLDNEFNAEEYLKASNEATNLISEIIQTKLPKSKEVSVTPKIIDISILTANLTKSDHSANKEVLNGLGQIINQALNFAFSKNHGDLSSKSSKDGIVITSPNAITGTKTTKYSGGKEVKEDLTF